MSLGRLVRMAHFLDQMRGDDTIDNTSKHLLNDRWLAREQVARLGISFWSEHTHEALARFVKDLGEFLEPDRRIDIVAQHRQAPPQACNSPNG